MTQIETSDLIRIAPNFVSASTILGSDSYLISEFPIQSDSVYPHWQAYVDGGITDGDVIQSLAGDGGLYGTYSGTLTLSLFTPDMQSYWFTNVMQSKYIAPVTLYVFHPRYKEMTITCYLTWFGNIANGGTQQTDTNFINVAMNWNRGVAVGGEFSSAFDEGFS